MKFSTNDTEENRSQDGYLNQGGAEIQPHGVLLVLHPETLRVLNVSANTVDILGIQPSQLIGQPLSTLFSTVQLHQVEQRLPVEVKSVVALELSVTTPQGLLPCYGFIHQTSDTVILELEPRQKDQVHQITTQIRDITTHLQRTDSLEHLLTVLVTDLQNFTGYHRVMVYQFDHQGAGEVIAEAKTEDLTAYLGLHFPAHDIPDFSRKIYACGTLRVIPDMAAEPIPLALSPDESASLDLGFSVLRSPSSCCAEYHGNMGVNASLVASLLKDGKLWGLISCHHVTAKFLPYEVRAGCEIITQMAAAELANKVRQEELKRQAQLTAFNSELISAIAQSQTFLEALIQPEERLLDLVNATGAAVLLRDDLTLLGTTPPPEKIRALIQWADQEVQDTLFHTNSLSSFYPEAEDFKDTGSGLLRLQFSKTPSYQLLWFREEVIQTVNWGGNPNENRDVDTDGNLRLSPRNSFDRWQEAVYGKALPWQPFELNAALDLRNAIVGIVLKKANELAQLNQALEQRNRELASFAYAAAHDLKEPLRGIYNYANVLLEDYTEALDQDGTEYLQEMQGFAQHMEALLNGLLRIAYLRQSNLHIEPVNLDQVVDHALTIIQASQPGTPFEIRRPGPLPQIACDEILISEVFSNLISNAIKYNDKAEKWIEIGCEQGRQASAPVLYVRDNGIGIQEKHCPVIFKLFKRLHPQEFYGGGAGVGLAVAHQIIERHNGNIWVESTPTQGSTFFFTLGTAIS